MRKSMADISTAHQEQEEKLLIEKTELASKVQDLTQKLTQQDKTIVLKEQDIEEIERDLETKNQKINELATEQIKRVETL